MDKLLIRVAEAAELASVGRSTAYELVASGEWPSVVVGRSVRVPLRDLREWVEREKRPGRHEGGDPTDAAGVRGR
ncbi:MAG: helix-turn-helix domain-containing protein [Chloroflexota bacterium]|nr:helix-turn-helix domain-containing protein [Chloroflexota bacterium]